MEQRIRKLIEEQKLSSSKFADAIGAQRSSISHILSGRNKPSLELINKILDRYPRLNTDWLLLGKGAMYTEEEPPPSKSTPPNYIFENESAQNAESRNKSAVKIVVFYSDKSFEEYYPHPG